MDLRPASAYAGQLLTPLAALGELAPIFVYTGGLVLAAGTTGVFVQTNLGNAIAGALLGVYFYLDSEDYQTSPVALVQFSAKSGQATVASGSALAGSPWNLQLGRDRNPFYFPSPFSRTWPQNYSLGLQVTNNEAVSVYAEGILVVAAWPQDARRDSDKIFDQRNESPFGASQKVFQ